MLDNKLTDACDFIVWKVGCLLISFNIELLCHTDNVEKTGRLKSNFGIYT